ncbi:poly-gamma-glutamate biosynthesis protein PgsC/CapC [Natrialbaceae archaeon GCM10025896]
MLAAALITIFGLAAGIASVQQNGLRMGGVIVVPLLAVYTLYSVVSLPLFLFSFGVAIVGVGWLHERTLIHGRTQLLASIAIGAVVPLLITAIFGLWGHSSVSDIAFVSTILPGLAAYNYHQLDPEKRPYDLALSAGVLIALFLFGVIMVSPTLADRLGTGLTSVLFSPGSDIAAARGATTGTVPETTVLSDAGVLTVIAVGMLGIEAAHARYGLRLGGLVALPLVVVLALTNWWAIPVYAIGVALIFGVATAVHHLTLVYGRVLLSLSLVAAMVYALVIAALGVIPISGFQLYFAAMFAGIGAYNLHLVAPTERGEAAALGAGLFVLLLGVSRIAVSPAETGRSDPYRLSTSWSA